MKIHNVTMSLVDDVTGQSIEFSIDKSVKHIAVILSSGTDSTIALITLIKYLQATSRTDTKISILSCASNKRQRVVARLNARVVEEVIHLTNYNIHKYCNYYHDCMDPLDFIRSLDNRVEQDQGIDLAITGITANPPPGETVVMDDGSIYDLTIGAHSGRESRNQDTIVHGDNLTYYFPFINVDKRFIASLYSTLDVDELFSSTRSCAAIPSDKYDRDFTLPSVVGDGIVTTKSYDVEDE